MTLRDGRIAIAIAAVTVLALAFTGKLDTTFVAVAAAVFVVPVAHLGSPRGRQVVLIGRFFLVGIDIVCQVLLLLCQRLLPRDY